MGLTVENIKSELSYAFLHAVAARGGFSCVSTDRHADNAGVDARVSVSGLLAPDSTLTDFTLEVQLKATAKRRSSTRSRPDHWSFKLELDHYDKLRKRTESQRLLVVFFLPQDDKKWLETTADSIVTRRCAYWMSLRDAPPSLNDTSQTVYLPKTNLLTSATLEAILLKLSREEKICYVS